MSENKGDIISREAALQELSSLCESWEDEDCTSYQALDIVENLPAVDAQPVVRTSYEHVFLCGGFAEKWGYRCGNCNAVTEINPQHFQKPGFCPMCGAEWSRGERQ